MIRNYRTEDLKELAELFYQTVHEANIGDYSPPVSEMRSYHLIKKQVKRKGIFLTNFLMEK